MPCSFGGHCLIMQCLIRNAGRQGKQIRLLTSRWEKQGSSHGREGLSVEENFPTKPTAGEVPQSLGGAGISV